MHDLVSVPCVFLSKSLVLILRFRESVIYLKLYMSLCVYKHFSKARGPEFSAYSQSDPLSQKRLKTTDPMIYQHFDQNSASKSRVL